MSIYRLFFFLLVAFAAHPLWAQSSVWELPNGQKVTAVLEYCDGEKIVLKPLDAKKSLEFPMSAMKPQDRSRAILSYYSERSRNSLRNLQAVAAKSKKDLLVSEEHLEDLKAIGLYLGELSKAASQKYIPKGEFMRDADYWTRAHSGMSYYIQSWLEELATPGEILKTGEKKRPQLADVLAHIGDFYSFFDQINRDGTFFQKHLGEQFPVKFSPVVYINDAQPYHYWVYLPKGYDGKTRLSLVFALTGRGEFGTNLDAILLTGLPKLLLSRKDYPFIVVAPQDCEPIAYPPYYQEILRDVLQRFLVDEDRIILTGLSAGGAGCWRWAVAEPTRFAAVVPVAAVAPFVEIASVRDTPIWIFNNEQDKIWIQDIVVSQMQPVNPNFKYTYYKDATGHNAWTETYSKPELEKWMALQKRNPNAQKYPVLFDTMEFYRRLSTPVLKTEPPGNFLTVAFDPFINKGTFADVMTAHQARYGGDHDSVLFEAASAIYNYQHFNLGQRGALPLVRFLPDTKDKGEQIYGTPVGSFQRRDINPPFAITSKPSFKCFSAYYLSTDANPQAALERLRRLATQAGHTLTGEDRILYLQFLMAKQNFYELQVGVK